MSDDIYNKNVDSTGVNLLELFITSQPEFHQHDWMTILKLNCPCSIDDEAALSCK